MTLDNLGLGFLQSWINFAVVSIASAQVSVLVTYAGLPLITGYMFFGLLIGPQICELVSNVDLDHLKYITQFALAFICLSAGAELYLPELKSLFKRILILTGCLTVITFVSVLFVVYGESMGGLASYVDTLPAGLESPGSCQFSIAMIAAAIMVSQSPASAIAVVRELGAKGPFTSTMLGVCVLIDVVVLLLATIATSIANSECDPTSKGFQVLDLGITLGTIIGAVGVGWLVGKIIIFVIWLPRVPGSWLVPWIGFGVFQLSELILELSTEHWGHPVNLDPLLICITAGYVVANQSRNRRKFLRFFNKAGPIIFIPFFTLTGAGLKLGVLFNSIPFALITAVTRAGAFAASSVIGGKWSDMPTKQRNTLWMSMITQAGVSLGIAAEVAMSFPSFGPDFKSVMIAVILINQILGPILCSKSLAMNGEVGMVSADEDEDDRIKRCLLIGVNDDSLAIAQRLLNANWDVLFVDTDPDKLGLTKTLSCPVRKHSHEGHEEAPALHSSKVRASEEDGPHGSDISKQSNSDGHDDSDLMPETSVIGSSSTLDPSEIQLAEPGSPREAPRDSAYIQVETQERVQTRLVDLPGSSLRSNGSRLLDTSDSNDLLQTGDRTARQHEAAVAAYSRAMTDLNSTNIQACVVFMQSDSLAWALCDRVLEKLQVTRVIAQINNPNWATMFASIGVLSIYSFSCTVAMIFRTIIMPQGGKLDLVNPKKPLHTQLAQMIRPEATDTLPVHLLYSSEEDQRAFLADHPNPPLATEQLWKFDERFKVVSAAQREEYLNSVYRVHAARLQINTRNNFMRAGATFSGPSMMAGVQDVDLSSREDELSGELSDLDDNFDLQRHEQGLQHSDSSDDDDDEKSSAIVR